MGIGLGGLTVRGSAAWRVRGEHPRQRIDDIAREIIARRRDWPSRLQPLVGRHLAYTTSGHARMNYTCLTLCLTTTRQGDPDTPLSRSGNAIISPPALTRSANVSSTSSIRYFPASDNAR